MTVGPRSWRGTLRPRAVAILTVVLGVAAAAAPATAASTPGAASTPDAASAPGADCQPYTGAPCLFPFPDDRLTVPDRKAVTGLRVQLPQAAMPRNTGGVQMTVSPYDAADGFSPGSAIVVHVPGLDNPAAMSKTGAVGLSNLGAARAKRAPIVVIDQATGRRQLIWAELDANATSPATTDLLIHPGKNFTEGHTYIVALRNLRTASGSVIQSPKWFARLRSGRRLGAQLRRQQTRYTTIFRSLRKAGIKVNNSLVRGVELHGRVAAVRDRPDARDPQQRVRAARRHEPVGPEGAGTRAGVHGHELDAVDELERHARDGRQRRHVHGRPGHLSGAVLPEGLRRQRDGRAFTTAQAAACTGRRRRSRATSRRPTSSASCRAPRRR